MTRKSATILVALSMVATGCESDRVIAPVPRDTLPALRSLIVRPVSVAMLPGLTTNLGLQALDQFGGLFGWNEDAVTFTSNNLAVASVARTGAITGVSPGRATITVTMTSPATKLERNVTVEVKDVRPGRFRLMAPVTESGWGMEGGSFRALVSLLPDAFSSETPAGAIGTFSDLLLVDSNGAIADSASAGWVTSQVDLRGAWIISLVVGQDVRWSGQVESIGQDDMIGSFRIGDGLAAGQFTARREGH